VRCTHIHAVCFDLLQYVAVCCGVLQGVAGCLLEGVLGCRRVLQGDAVYTRRTAMTA